MNCQTIDKYVQKELMCSARNEIIIIVVVVVVLIIIIIIIIIIKSSFIMDTFVTDA